MRKVTVNRPQKMKLPFSKGKILLNNNEHEIVKAGKTVTFEIPDGYHDIQVVFAAVPPVTSNALRIDTMDGDTIFEVKINVPLNADLPTEAVLTRV